MEHTELGNRQVRLHLIAAGLLLFVLLCWDLGGRELWTDEEFSLAAAAPLEHAAFGDASHPPLYPTLLHFWLQVEPRPAPNGAFLDGWLRLFSIPWALLAWWLGWLIAARLNLRREGVVAAWLMAISPLILTYFRMGRYYSFAAALTLLAIYLLVVLWQRRDWVTALVLAIATAAVGYTDYVGFLLVGALLALSVVLALVRRDRRLAGQCLVAGVAALWMLYPIVLMTLQHTGTVGLIPADPLAGSVWGFTVKLALPLFSLATGECIDPWRWSVTLPAVVVTVGLLLVGLWRMLAAGSRSSSSAAGPPARAGEPPALLEGGMSAPDTPRLVELPQSPDLPRLVALAWPLNILIGAVMMSTVAANVPPNRITSFAMFTIPLAYLTLARGLTSLHHKTLALLCLLLLIGVYAYGAANYFHRQQLLNPGFAPPWRQVTGIIKRHEQSGDLVLSIENAFKRYYDGHALVGQEPEIRQMIAGGLPFDRRVWLITRDRGSQEMLGYGLELRDKLLQAGATEQVWNIMPRSPQEQRMLSFILRRQAWDAYVKLYLLTPRPPRQM